MSHYSRSFFALADTVGDGTGTQDAIGDYSLAVEEFKVTPATGEILTVNQVIIAVTDGAAMSGSAYGSDLVLSNGIEIMLINGNDDVRQDITDGLPVITNTDLARLGPVTELVFGAGDQGLQCLLTFDEPLIVRDSERLAFRLNDDFSDLVHHYFTVIGTVKHVD